MKTPRTCPGILVAALLAGALPMPLLAQEAGSIVGIVLEDERLTPIEGATVEVMQSGVRAGTDRDGAFTLRNLPAGPLTLRVRSEGHVALVEDVDIRAEEVALVQFRLPRLAAAFDDIVVEVGGRPAGAERSPSREGLRSEATALDLLANRVPGVDIRHGDGAAGGQPLIVIRGYSSVTLSNAPIVYVDGNRLSGTDILTQIPAADVESIRVLRGASAGSQYMETANGIIQITTRRGPGRDGGGLRDGAR